jgi:choline monooxygenase
MPRSDRLKGFDHAFIFPNLMIGVNEGVNACVQHFNPGAVERIDAKCWLLTGTPDAKLHNGIIWQTVTKQWQTFSAQSWNEDRVICETAQIGIRHARRKALLGLEEDRARRFQAMLLERTEHDIKEKAA